MGIREEKNHREIERRLLAVRICEEGGGTPEVRRAVARAYGVDERTVRRWEQRVREGKPVYEDPGRPPDEVPRARRQTLIRAMLKLGPHAGVPTLRAQFADVPYRFLAKMKRRLTRAITRRRGWYRKRLRWLRAGAVWATDFTKPAAGLWQEQDRLFLVRDLGSSAQLAAVACRGERGRTARAVLLSLFLLFGAPLALKSDNGSAFRAHQTTELLAAHGVTPLFSPPYWPQYNGACERSGGTFKARVEYRARLRGRPGCWLPEDVDDALRVANTTARPWGATGPTPAEALRGRTPVTQSEREAFQATRARAIKNAVQTFKAETGTMPTCSQHATIDRKATQLALCKHGYLEIRRGRLSTPISTWKAGTKA
ncbi:MAG: DDE-type integrase/transposase/recombinase [Planctomycetota bacterium]|nr:DDE-type integrase/transposase/recombinase [Planctomycetota bacterium]